jgi:nitric oxide reductase activation protein
MKRESADSKLIIFFTDGMPTYNTDRYIGDSQCRRAVRDAKKSGIDYFGILSSDYGGGDFMNRIFGKNYKALPLKNAIRYMEKIMQEHIKATLQR